MGNLQNGDFFDSLGRMFNLKFESYEVIWTQHIEATLDFMDSMNLIKDAVKKR